MPAPEPKQPAAETADITPEEEAMLDAAWESWLRRQAQAKGEPAAEGE